MNYTYPYPHLHSANRGCIRKKYPDEHINQANCLNLITNAFTGWNTVYIQVAIDHLRGREQEISEDDLVYLSPAHFEHINIYGKYSFDISVPLSNGGLRPLGDQFKFTVYASLLHSRFTR